MEHQVYLLFKELINLILFFFSYLYLARADNPAIVRYNPADDSVLQFNIVGSAQSLSVDEFNNVIYWAGYDVDQDSYVLQRTLLNQETFPLNITYSGTIKITSDEFNLYVLDQANDRIDKYRKTTLSLVANISSPTDIEDLTIAYG